MPQSTDNVRNPYLVYHSTVAGEAPHRPHRLGVSLLVDSASSSPISGSSCVDAFTKFYSSIVYTSIRHSSSLCHHHNPIAYHTSKRLASDRCINHRRSHELALVCRRISFAFSTTSDLTSAVTSISLSSSDFRRFTCLLNMLYNQPYLHIEMSGHAPARSRSSMEGKISHTILYNIEEFLYIHIGTVLNHCTHALDFMLTIF